MFTNYTQFQAVDRLLRTEGGKMSERFLTHIKMATTLFHGQSNHNIQIANDLLDTASAMRLPRNKIIDWLVPLLGHKVVQEEVEFDGKKVKQFIFGEKLKDTDYEVLVANAPQHFVDYPSWVEFKREAAPDAFDEAKDYKMLIKLIEKRMLKFAENGAIAKAARIGNAIKVLTAAQSLSEPVLIEGEVILEG